MVIITPTINILVYIEILDSLLIPLIDNWFHDGEVIFQDVNASCHRAEGLKDFLQESMTKRKMRIEMKLKIERRFWTNQPTNQPHSHVQICSYVYVELFIHQKKICHSEKLEG